MASTEEDLREGLSLQETGKWKPALECYLRAVASGPTHPLALFRAGIALAHEGQMDLSAELLRRSLASDPKFSDAAKALGGVLLSLNRHKEAVEALEKACELSPGSAAALCDLGTAYAATGDFERAASNYTKAIVLKPDFAGAHNKLGNVQRFQGLLEKAALSYKRAIRAEPGQSQAWYNLGATLQMEDKFPKALEAYQQSLAIEPRNPSAENNMGLILKAQGRITEAIDAFLRAIALKPDYALAMMNLGATLQAANRPQDAVTTLEAAITLDAKSHQAHSNLGNALVALNRPADGLASYEKALELDPTSVDIRYNIGLSHLVLGDLEQGWAGYELRLETEDHRKKHTYAAPAWHRDQPTSGKTILLYAEQGLGDTLQFIRYVPVLQAMGASVILKVQSSLKVLLSGQFGEAVVVSGDDPLPPHDFRCSLMSLPGEMSTRLETIPSKGPYLKAPAAKLELWRKVFAKAPGPKIGLVWSGNSKHQFDHIRSAPVGVFAEMTKGIPAHFFAIQKEIREADLARLPEYPWINDLSRKIQGFEDTAAIVAALDLVITVDTSVAHLAGALGAKAWVLLGFAPDWRWLLNRNDSPWYPSVRLFRQPNLGDWPSVTASVRAELQHLGS
jgi:tetratricopeptide (TPR) repeat protein